MIPLSMLRERYHVEYLSKKIFSKFHTDSSGEVSQARLTWYRQIPEMAVLEGGRTEGVERRGWLGGSSGIHCCRLNVPLPANNLPSVCRRAQ